MAGFVDPRLLERLLDEVHRVLSARRYLHVLGVSHIAMLLAELHHLDLGHALLAALLHDISKELTPEQIATDMARWGRPIGNEDIPHPRTWHGLHAAVVAELQWDIHDADVLQAIADHTTGEADVGLLAQLLIVSDFCEPGRKIAEAPEVLALARRDLTAAFCRALDLKTQHMLAKPAFQLHSRTWRCLQFWLPERVANAPHLALGSLATGSQ
jgi:predicted HD superfamily hydrolase involved in NAD metabolism